MLVEIKFSNKITFLTGIKLKRAAKALFLLWSLKKRKLRFIEKVRKKKFWGKTYKHLNSKNILTLKHQKYMKC